MIWNMQQMNMAFPASPAVSPRQKSSGGASSKYEPISSVWESGDSDLLESMFNFYATIPVEPILDATYNAGRFWKGSTREVVSMDIDPRYKPMIVGDNRKMKGVPSWRFGVVVYDPPHVGPQSRDKSKKRFDVDFGATIECGYANGHAAGHKSPSTANTCTM